MAKFCTSILILFIASILHGGNSAALLPDEEVSTLHDMARKLEYRGWRLHRDPCNEKTTGNRFRKSRLQKRVICNCSYENETICHVISIELKSQNLVGVLPSEVARLPFLRKIDFSRNFLQGSIPLEWGSLQLTHISLFGNRLSGEIPKHLGRITSLIDLNMEANRFTGTIPQELGHLINLERLFLSSNELSGKLPVTLANLTKLKDIRMSDNNFQGRIPDFIRHWTLLETLHLQGCSLEGPIPSAISVLKKLTELKISDLKGTGSSFPLLNNMENMTTLILRKCQIFGNIPEFVGELKNLKILDLSFNQLTDLIPRSFEGLENLKYLYLSRNMLTGPIPRWTLDKSTNMDFSYNNFTEIQSPALSDCSVRRLNLLKAYAPTVNPAPLCMGNFLCAGHDTKYHHSLYINCGGDVVTTRGNVYEPDIQLGLASGFLLQKYVGVSMTGNFMDNAFIGDFIATNTSPLSMPNPELFMTARLSPLSLSYYGFCLKNGNYTVGLYFSELFFSEDETFQSLGKRIFDIYLQGNLVLKDFNIANEAGGPGREIVKRFNVTVTSHVLEIQLYWAGKGTQSIPRRGVYGPLISAISVDPDFDPFSRGHPKLIMIVVITVAAGIVALVVLVIIWRTFQLAKKVQINRDTEMASLQGTLTLSQIRVATNNFDDSNKIGSGASGDVYKGTLPSGTIVAVKKLCEKSERSIQDLVSEVGIMSAMRHPNLVMLYGCCAEEDNLLLIYEYMENGALSRALFDVGDELPIRLDWQTRMEICLGIAKGLAYLHDESGISIIHRDIKADNILLDCDLNAKVSDFGLSKLITDDHDLSFHTLCGTPGYIAPEILRGDPWTKKVDVFSFGVLVIEIICGQKSSTYSALAGFTSLVHRVFAVHSQGGDLLELVDSKLDLQFCQEEALALFRVGILCCQNSPTLRPSMLTVVSMLEGQTAVEVSMDVELVGNSNTRGFTDQNSTRGTDVSGAISSIRRHMASGKQPFLGTT